MNRSKVTNKKPVTRRPAETGRDVSLRQVLGGPPDPAGRLAAPKWSHAFDLNRQNKSVSFRMRELVKLFGRGLSSDLNRCGVTLGQWRFLRVLWEGDGRSQRELGDVLGFTSAATVFAINLLERDGLAVRKRTDEDSRICRVYLTPKSRGLRERLLPHARKIQMDALQGMSDSEIASFLSILDRMKANLERAVSARTLDAGDGQQARAKSRKRKRSAKK